MITLRKGNIFDSKAKAVVIPVNCEGVMGKGLALEFKKRFPWAYAYYKGACGAGDLTIGRVLEISVSWRTFIFFPTKDRWRNPSKLEYIEEGLPALVNALKNRVSVAIPALGCGLGGLRWPDVRPMIERAFSRLPKIEVELFEPQP